MPIYKATHVLVFTCWLVSQVFANLEPCAIIRPTSASSEEIPLSEESLSIGYDFVRADENQADAIALGKVSVIGNLMEHGWNNGSTYTVNMNVESSCELKMCTGVYLTGDCFEYSDGNFYSSELQWQSAHCTCSSGCSSCTPNFNKNSVCARAYLQPQTGSCPSCDGEYTELDIGAQDLFPENWRQTVSSVFVKKRCNLAIFDDEDFEGETTSVSGPVFKPVNGNLASYKCTCNASTPVETEPESGTSAITKMGIPNDLDGVIERLHANNWDHPGLLAALSSLSQGRSSKNVYILLIGSSGAGKSSLINVLLGNNITTVGDWTSTTSEIQEFRIPIPVPELGIANSELRIIDTPGLGDTRGIDRDASFLATLENYLTTHEELQSRKPNFIIVMHRFDDNRFSGQSATFVRMIRALDTIRPLLTPSDQYPNVLFLFSHLSSVSKSIQRNPLSRLMEFQQAVQQFSFFPKPILSSVGENMGTDNLLPMISGNFLLPNKELYPKNLLDKMNMISEKIGDKMGNAVVNADIVRNQQINPEANITIISHPMVSSSHQSVSKFLKVLSSGSTSFNATAVSQALQTSYQNMPSSLKSRFPGALENLQRYLNLKGIGALTDIPQTLTLKLDLISEMKQNEATEYLLKNGLDFQAPTFTENIKAGYNYNIFKRSMLPVSPFQMTNLRYSNSLGFRIPNGLRVTKVISPGKPVNSFRSFDTKRQYFQHRTTFLLGESLASVVNSTDLYSALTSNPEPGYFVKENRCQGASNMYCFTVTRFYKTFKFALDPSTTQLQSSFASTIENLPKFNQSNFENVEQWTNFFREYGTHVVSSAEVGGRIDIHFTINSESSNTSAVNAAVDKITKILEFAENPLETSLSHREDFRQLFSSSNAAVNHTLTFHGGDRKYHVQDFSRHTLEEAVSLMSNWRKSLKYLPVVFPSAYVPIGKAVYSFMPSSKQTATKEKIEVALERLLSSTLKYVPPGPDPKEVEEQERVKKELEKMKREMEAQLEKAEEEKRKKEKEAVDLVVVQILERFFRDAIAQIREKQRQQALDELEEQRQRWRSG